MAKGSDLIRRGDLIKRVERVEKQGKETVPLEWVQFIIESTPAADLSKLNKANGWTKLPRGSIQVCKECGAVHPFQFWYCPHCGKKVQT